jgi:hypothetical protein
MQKVLYTDFIESVKVVRFIWNVTDASSSSLQCWDVGLWALICNLFGNEYSHPSAGRFLDRHISVIIRRSSQIPRRGSGASNLRSMLKNKKRSSLLIGSGYTNIYNWLHCFSWHDPLQRVYEINSTSSFRTDSGNWYLICARTVTLGRGSHFLMYTDKCHPQGLDCMALSQWISWQSDLLLVPAVTASTPWYLWSSIQWSASYDGEKKLLNLIQVDGRSFRSFHVVLCFCKWDRMTTLHCRVTSCCVYLCHCRARSGQGQTLST